MNSVMVFNISLAVFCLAELTYLLYLMRRAEGLGLAATIIAWVGFAVETVAFLLRTFEFMLAHQRRLPLTNLYESLVFFAWAVALLYLIYERKYKLRGLGAFVLPLTILALAAPYYIPGVTTSIPKLPPALQSAWLEWHVMTCFLGYGAFGVASVLALLYLVKAPRECRREMGAVMRLLPSADMLDEVCYRAILIGVPLLTAGIVLGAVWANQAWGTYWSWDPKETWALIVWLVYAAYLHARITRGWRGKKAAYLALLGFAATLFCYLGVNLLLSGLHSYGSVG
nr:c-type cytochrome biogenesis protein CcsB [uncultured Holophaga sp.]